MTTNRLEAFSDGVLAIIITVMVLELKVPDGTTLHDLRVETGVGFLTYLLSFVYIGIYWNNHHHVFQLVRSVSGPVLWANLHLLFWLSLFPLTTSWMDGSDLAITPTAVYGVDLLMAALAYTVLELTISRMPAEGARLRQALGGRDVKGLVSLGACLAGIGLSFVAPWLGLVLYAVVAIPWLVPDRRIERYLAQERGVPLVGEG